MTSRLKHVNPLQFGIVCGALYFLLGIIGAVFAWIFIGMIAARPMALLTPGLSSMTSPLSFIFLPIFYAICGFLGGIICGWFYNIVAGWTGGIEIRLDVSAPYEAVV
jgi:hypothetical protein